MRTKTFVSMCTVLVLTGFVIVPAAQAWGPNASRAICLCALQIIRRDIDRAFVGREDDVVAGATIPDSEVARYGVQEGQIEPFEPIISEIALLRRARQREVTDYLAFRFGVIAKMTANAIQPFGIPANEGERRLRARFDADIEKHIEQIEVTYRRGTREFLYYPTSYFRERRKFVKDAKELIEQEYATGQSYGELTARAVSRYFEDAVDTVCDVWYTMLIDREYYREAVPSPRDLAQYYVGQVEYFLRPDKSAPDKAEEAYATFAELNPGLATPYEDLGDIYYRAGDDARAAGDHKLAPGYYERAMDEYRRGLSMREGSWPELEDKIVKHYTRAGATFYAQKTGETLRQALQAYEKALQVVPGNPTAVKGREDVVAEIKAMEARLARDKELLAGGDRLFEEAGQAQSASDYGKAIGLYEKAAAVYSLVSDEFEQQSLDAQEGGESVGIQITSILSTVLGEAEDRVSRAARFEADSEWEQAIPLYDRIPQLVSVISEKYPDQYADAQRLIRKAEQKKKTAEDNLAAQQAAQEEERR